MHKVYVIMDGDSAISAYKGWNIAKVECARLNAGQTKYSVKVVLREDCDLPIWG